MMDEIKFSENTELLKRSQAGDESATEEMMKLNAGLVQSIALKCSGRGVDLEDLIQIGNIGMLKAIRSFDFSRGCAFSTYAVPKIAGEIRRFLRDDGMLHVSRQIKENARKIAAAKEELKKTNNCEPAMEELARMTGLTMDDILMAMEATTEIESIYQPIYAGKDGSQVVLADQLEDVTKNENENRTRI